MITDLFFFFLDKNYLISKSFLFIEDLIIFICIVVSIIIFLILELLSYLFSNKEIDLKKLAANEYKYELKCYDEDTKRWQYTTLCMIFAFLVIFEFDVIFILCCLTSFIQFFLSQELWIIIDFFRNSGSILIYFWIVRLIKIFIFFLITIHLSERFSLTEYFYPSLIIPTILIIIFGPVSDSLKNPFPGRDLKTWPLCECERIRLEENRRKYYEGISMMLAFVVIFEFEVIFIYCLTIFAQLCCFGFGTIIDFFRNSGRILIYFGILTALKNFFYYSIFIYLSQYFFLTEYFYLYLIILITLFKKFFVLSDSLSNPDPDLEKLSTDKYKLECYNQEVKSWYYYKLGMIVMFFFVFEIEIVYLFPCFVILSLFEFIKVLVKDWRYTTLGMIVMFFFVFEIKIVYLFLFFVILLLLFLFKFIRVLVSKVAVFFY